MVTLNPTHLRLSITEIPQDESPHPTQCPWSWSLLSSHLALSLHTVLVYNWSNILLVRLGSLCDQAWKLGADRFPLPVYGMLCGDSHDGKDIHSPTTRSVGLWFGETLMCRCGREPWECSLCYCHIDRTQLTSNGGPMEMHKQITREPITRLLIYQPQ